MFEHDPSIYQRDQAGRALDGVLSASWHRQRHLRDTADTGAARQEGAPVVLGDILKIARFARGLSRREMAAAVGLPVLLVTGAEQGRAMLGPRELAAWARALEVTVSILTRAISLAQGFAQLPQHALADDVSEWAKHCPGMRVPVDRLHPGDVDLEQLTWPYVQPTGEEDSSVAAFRRILIEWELSSLVYVVVANTEATVSGHRHGDHLHLVIEAVDEARMEIGLKPLEPGQDNTAA